MVQLCRFLRRKVWHLPVAAYLAVLLVVAVCAAARQKDDPIEIRHTLDEYTEDQAVLAVVTPVLLEETGSKHYNCLFLADKKGRMKCITEDQWESLVRRNDLPPKARMSQGGWESRTEEEKKERAETVQVYDAILKDGTIPYLDQRIYLNHYYITRLINEIYPSVTVGWSCWGPAMPYPEIDSRDLYTGMVVAYGEERMALGYADSQIGLVHMDSPTTEYALRKLAELAVIGEKEMSRRLRE